MKSDTKINALSRRHKLSKGFSHPLFWVALVGALSCSAQKSNSNEHESMETVHSVSVYGFLHAKPERYDELKSELLTLARASREEPGNLIYNVHQEKDSTFFIYEVWRSQEDFDRHVKLPHVQEFMVKVKNFLKRDIEAYLGPLISSGVDTAR
jgi:quinol monooxygenase YgiN